MKKVIGFNEQGRRKRARETKRAIAKAMKMTGHTYRDIAEVLDVSISTVNAMIRHDGPELTRLTEEIIKREGKRHRLLSEYILSQISDRDITRASLKEKIIASAILTDKAILIEGMQRQNATKGAETEQNAEQEAGRITLEYQEVTDN